MSILLNMLLAGKTVKLLQPILTRNYQVTVIGAGNEIGQTVALLLRSEPLISKLVLHDFLETIPGVTMDLSHVPAESAIQSYTGEKGLEPALKDSKLVIATGGAVKRPGMTHQQWLESNISFIKKIAVHIARCTPMPIVGIATEPINSIVPMAAEIMMNNGNFDSRRLLGITTVDILRSQCLYAYDHQLCPCDCFVPTIGGHSNKTMIPLLSQTQPHVKCYNEQYAMAFTDKLRNCDGEIEKYKKGWSAILSTSYGIVQFVRNVLEALDGRFGKVNAFVENNDFGTSYFSGIVKVDDKGYSEMQRYENLSSFEVNLLETSLEYLRKEINIGNKILEKESDVNVGAESSIKLHY